jgi:four helix bundle protein
MARIKDFEDLQSWKKAREVVNLIYDLTDKGTFSIDFELLNQIRRSAGSVMHNIAEEFESGSNNELSDFCECHVDQPARSSLNYIWRWIETT